ncbi:MAG TPA: hypothetical protein ENJ45_05795 [Phaeodactylibacter sp.]|nr:hypothetical protein [Phaeodactylibacter sp.]
MQTKHPTYRLSALLLALLMLSTAMSFSIDVHYCGGKMQSFSLFGKAANCYELAGYETPSTCTQHAQKKQEDLPCTIDQKECCHNQLLQIDFDQTQLNQSTHLVANTFSPHFTISPITATIPNRLPNKEHSKGYLPHHEPRIAKDIPVLFQSFLL